MKRTTSALVVGVLVVLIGFGVEIGRRSSLMPTNHAVDGEGGADDERSTGRREMGIQKSDGIGRTEGKSAEVNGAESNSIPVELSYKKTNAYYIMIYEGVEGRKLVEENAKKNAEAYGERIDSEYAAMFSSFGLSDKSRSLLSNHLASIEQGRAEAESYLVQLGVAKEMYDKTARQLLSPEQYKEYRTTEEARPAQRELKAIGEFFSAEGIAAFGADQQSRLYEALKASKSTPVADGPYGSGAHALVGKQPVFDATTEDLRRLRAEHSTLLSNLPTTPEWDTVRQGISQYYGAQILGKQKTLEFMSQESPVHPPIPGQP